MKTILAELQANSSKSYDAKSVSAYIKLIKRTTDPNLQERLKYKLFLLLSRLIIKGINNFSYLTRNVPPYKLIHSEDDIAMECYIVMDTCVKNLKEGQISGFYFYYNSGLNRAIYRIFEKGYKKHFDVVENSDQNAYLILNSGYAQHIDTTDLELKDLTPEEKAVLEHKLSGEKLRTFLKKHNIKSTQFHQVFESLKVKIKHIYHYQNNE